MLTLSFKQFHTTHIFYDLKGRVNKRLMWQLKFKHLLLYFLTGKLEQCRYRNRIRQHVITAENKKFGTARRFYFAALHRVTNCRFNNVMHKISRGAFIYLNFVSVRIKLTV